MRGGGDAPRTQPPSTPQGDVTRKEKATLRSREEAQAYIALHKVTHLVAYEFSGAVLRALQARGLKAMSCDLRAAEHEGPHYEGDVSDIVDLQMWDAIYFIGPDCYQHLRWDLFCLEHKIADGRAFWGGAKVLWCICCPHARMIIVEQPDTIGHDYMDLASLPGVSVKEMRTSEAGDKSDKFMRFTLVNAVLPEVRGPRKRAATPRRSHRAYADVEEQCRDRSTWLHHPETSQMVAMMMPINPEGPLPRDYGERIEIFKKKWEEAGHVAPPDYNHPKGEPPDEETRRYQLERGVGDPKRRLPGAKEASAHTVRRAAPVAVRPSQAGIAARRAEHGDQEVASDMNACATSLIERRKRLGYPLTPEQARCWERITAQAKANGARPARADREEMALADDEKGQQPSGRSVSTAMRTYEKNVLLPAGKKAVETGAGGDCGYNATAFAEGHIGGRKLTGASLRSRSVKHAELLVERDEDWTPNYKVREMLLSSMASWDARDLGRATPSATAWLANMRNRGCWIDQGGLQMVADYLEVQIRYHVVRPDGTQKRTGLLQPRATTVVRAELEIALEQDHSGGGVHYVAVVGRGEVAKAKEPPTMVGDAGEQSQEAYSLDPALVPTQSQYQVLLQESEDEAKEWAMAATTESEVAALAEMVSASEIETPPCEVLLAMERSRAVAEAVEMKRAIEACEAAQAQEEPQAVIETRSEGRALEDAAVRMAIEQSKELAREVERARAGMARLTGGKSVRGADQDLILEEDTDEEYGDFEGGSPTVEGEEWTDFRGGGCGPRELDTPRRLTSTGRFLGKGRSNCVEGDGADQDVGAVAQRHGADEPPMVRATDDPAGMVIVVPYTVRDGEPLLLTPSQDDAHLGFRQEADGGETQPVVERAEQLVRQGLPPSTGGAEDATGLAAGRDDQGARLVVVATKGHAKVGVARSTMARAQHISAGATLLWCSLAALSSPSWQEAASKVAVATASHFTSHDGLTSTLLRQELQARRDTGLEAGRTEYLAPVVARLEARGGPTPRSLLEQGQTSRHLEKIRGALREVGGGDSTHYELFADAAQPMCIAELSPQLLDQEIAIRDDSLSKELFSPPLPVYETPWLDRAPSQRWEERPGCEGFVAWSALDLVDEEARGELGAWFEAAKADALCLEELGADCDRRDKPPAIAIGQDQVHECARGYVFDCREAPCKLLDYEEQLSTDWNLEYLRSKLEGYPDQRLASNVLEGVRLEADGELMTVLSPQLVSVGPGYGSVQRTVRELHTLGFYDFFAELPFWPIIIVGQGAQIKSLGSASYRRTSNFSGPHKLVTDKKGNRAVPINEASKSYELPDWLLHSWDEATARWARGKYRHVPTMEGGRRSAAYKFPKERKPALANVMRDLAILLHASLEMNEPIFLWVEDAAHYFNQFGYAAEELWKSTFLVNARPEDVANHGGSFEPGQLVFVSEKRLGFGTYASSNIAQRFSNAITGWTMEAFDKLEAEARVTHPDAAWEAWIAKRRPLEEECRRQRPKQNREALGDCTQTRLAVLTMYTDDPLGGVVGVERAQRLLRAWREVTKGVNLRMAGADKRQMGGGVEWIGVSILAALGIVAIPKNKLLRARDAIERTLAGKITFGEYRALVGLLEHLRFVARLQADVTNVLYRPHSREGESRGGPSTTVQPTGLMVSALHRWLAIIMQCAGAALTIVFTTSATERLGLADTIISSSSDAAGDGRGTPGMGGYTHGYFWRVNIPPVLLSLLHITAWETLAACVNILVAARLAGPDVVLAMQVDALLTPYVISNQRSRSVDVQRILHGLLNDPLYRLEIAGRLVCRHLSGEGNVPADFASRGLWKELATLCEQLKVKPVLVRLTVAEKRLVCDALRDTAARKQVDLDEEAMSALFVDTLPDALSGGRELGTEGEAEGQDRTEAEATAHPERYHAQPIRQMRLKRREQLQVDRPWPSPLSDPCGRREPGRLRRTEVPEGGPASGRRRPRSDFEGRHGSRVASERPLTAAERFLGKGRRNCADGDGPTAMAREARERLASTPSWAVILSGDGAAHFFDWCVDDQGGGWDDPWEANPYEEDPMDVWLTWVDTHPLCLFPLDAGDPMRLGILGVTDVPSEWVARQLIDRFLRRRSQGGHNGMTRLWIVLGDGVEATHEAAHHEVVTEEIFDELVEDGILSDPASSEEGTLEEPSPYEAPVESAASMEVEACGEETDDGADDEVAAYHAAGQSESPSSQEDREGAAGALRKLGEPPRSPPASPPAYVAPIHACEEERAARAIQWIWRGVSPEMRARRGESDGRHAAARRIERRWRQYQGRLAPQLFWALVRRLAARLPHLGEPDIGQVVMGAASHLLPTGQRAGTGERQPPTLISVEGGVGAGKSTCLANIAELYRDDPEVAVLQEPVEAWRESGALEQFYRGTLSRLEFQLIAMSTLVLPVIRALHAPGVRLVISERSLRSNREVFAVLNLSEQALVGLDLLYHALEAATPVHHEATLYLDASASTLRRRVEARGRQEEGALGLDFHMKVKERHDQMFAAIDRPKAKINAEGDALGVARDVRRHVRRLDPRRATVPTGPGGWLGVEFDSTKGYPGEGPPVEHIGNLMTYVGPAYRQGQSIGRGLFASRGIEVGERTAVMGVGACMPSEWWDAYADPRGLPEWAAFESDRRNRMGEAVKFYDASWDDNLPQPSGEEAVRPKWSFMNHSKYRPNCRVVPPAGPGNYAVSWVAVRRIAPHDEITFEYGGANEDYDERELAELYARGGTRGGTNHHAGPRRPDPRKKIQKPRWVRGIAVDVSGASSAPRGVPLARRASRTWSSNSSGGVQGSARGSAQRRRWKGPRRVTPPPGPSVGRPCDLAAMPSAVDATWFVVGVQAQLRALERQARQRGTESSRPYQEASGRRARMRLRGGGQETEECTPDLTLLLTQHLNMDDALALRAIGLHAASLCPDGRHVARPTCVGWLATQKGDGVCLSPCPTKSDELQRQRAEDAQPGRVRMRLRGAGHLTEVCTLDLAPVMTQPLRIDDILALRSVDQGCRAVIDALKRVGLQLTTGPDKLGLIKSVRLVLHEVKLRSAGGGLSTAWRWTGTPQKCQGRYDLKIDRLAGGSTIHAGANLMYHVPDPTTRSALAYLILRPLGIHPAGPNIDTVISLNPTYERAVEFHTGCSLGYNQVLIPEEDYQKWTDTAEDEEVGVKKRIRVILVMHPPNGEPSVCVASNFTIERYRDTEDGPSGFAAEDVRDDYLRVTSVAVYTIQVTRNKQETRRWVNSIVQGQRGPEGAPPGPQDPATSHNGRPAPYPAIWRAQAEPAAPGGGTSASTPIHLTWERGCEASRDGMAAPTASSDEDEGATSEICQETPPYDTPWYPRGFRWRGAIGMPRLELPKALQRTLTWHNTDLLSYNMSTIWTSSGLDEDEVGPELLRSVRPKAAARTIMEHALWHGERAPVPEPLCHRCKKGRRVSICQSASWDPTWGCKPRTCNAWVCELGASCDLAASRAYDPSGYDPYGWMDWADPCDCPRHLNGMNWQYEITDRTPPPRSRSLSPTESFLGSRRSNCPDADGPVFRPPWMRSQEERAQPHAPVDTGRAFAPAWARPAPTPIAPPGDRAHVHPYLAPAYRHSRLRSDQVAHAKNFAQRLVRDKSDGRIGAPAAALEEMAMAVAEARADGINPRTASKDAFALREFEAFAALSNFDPNLRTEWTKAFPERESLKLASFLLFRAQRALPRSKRNAVAKPMSIYQNYLALRRVFRARDVELPPSGTVRETLRGLLRRFVRRYGIERLRPCRVEPVTPAIVMAVVRVGNKGDATIKGKRWVLTDWSCFIVTAWMVINLSVGSRKGESTRLPGDVDHSDWFNRAAVTFEIRGRTYTDPSRETLTSMREGCYAMLAPKGSKCDQYGTCHGTEPIILPYHDDHLNAAKWLRDIELRWPARGQQRIDLPLFPTAEGRPYNDGAFASLIMAALTHVLGEARARLLSPHSWRVWLASSLRMCDASDARIQAFGRWLNPDSLKIYARMSKQEYAAWVDKLMAVKHIDTARTTSLPVMDAADAIAMWGSQLMEDDTGPGEQWDTEPTHTTAAQPGPAPLATGARIEVYWTELQEWFSGTFTSSRVEEADGGGQQRSSRIVYDATGPWASCSAKQLTYWHCLDDETWRLADQAA